MVNYLRPLLILFPFSTFALIALLGSTVALAQDAAVVNPATVHVKLDNAHVRVLESVLSPGQKERIHSHPACVIYVVSGGKVRNHTSDGKSVDVVLSTGDTIYRDPITHWSENTGATAVHLILVELKNSK